MSAAHLHDPQAGAAVRRAQAAGRRDWRTGAEHAAEMLERERVIALTRLPAMRASAQRRAEAHDTPPRRPNDAHYFAGPELRSRAIPNEVA